MVFYWIIGFPFLLDWIAGIQKVYPRKLNLFRTKSAVLTSVHGDHRRTPTGITDDTARIEREDVRMVMEKLGMMCRSDENNDEEEEELAESMDVGELASMFEEEEPSMEELQRAFSVYDKNRDGFIDADELQRVLSELGFFDDKRSLPSSSSVEAACRRMIATYDENKDGKIDFSEFLKIDFF